MNSFADFFFAASTLKWCLFRQSETSPTDEACSIGCFNSLLRGLGTGDFQWMRTRTQTPADFRSLVSACSSGDDLSSQFVRSRSYRTVKSARAKLVDLLVVIRFVVSPRHQTPFRMR